MGVGNPILGDDAVGLLAVRETRREFNGEPVSFVEACAGGLDLIDLLCGHEAAVIVDAVVTGRASPGEVLDLDPSFLEDSSHLGTTGLLHQVDLATAWQLGRRVGLPLPAVVRVLGVEAAQTKTFSEELSPRVAIRFPRVVRTVARVVRETLGALETGSSDSSGSGPGGPGGGCLAEDEGRVRLRTKCR